MGGGVRRRSHIRHHRRPMFKRNISAQWWWRLAGVRQHVQECNRAHQAFHSMAAAYRVRISEPSLDDLRRRGLR